MWPHSGELIGIDTNVLLRYFLRDDEEQYLLAETFLGTLSQNRPGFITHVVLVDMMRALTRCYGMKKDSALAILRALVASDSLEFEDGESVVRALALAANGADFADGLIHASGEMFGTTSTVTFDRRAAARLGWHDLGTA